MKAGTKQIEMSHDEGETATQIAECMEVVFQALPQSSRSPGEQILWAVNMELSDEYDLCGDTEAFWDREWEPEAWSAVADDLARRLDTMKPKKDLDGSFEKFQRDRLSNWLIHALQQAGRDGEVIPLCEQEAERTGSYVRLVDVLMEAERWEEAAQWAQKGVEITRASWPGIASELRDRLRGLSERSGDLLRAAAFRADEFFDNPSLSNFRELEKAAKKAEVWPIVRAYAMHYLETGQRPPSRDSAVEGIPVWPLPDTGVAVRTRPRQPDAPMISVLMDIAIAEKKPEEVLRWYDRARSGATTRFGWAGYDVDRVAEAVVKTHPERAADLWKDMAEAQIAYTQPKAYEVAAGYLRKAHRVLQQLGQEENWKAYLAQLRETHRRKRRLLEILDRLDGRRIVDG